MTQSPYFTISQAATVLGMHPQKLRRLERAGRIPPAPRSGRAHDRYYPVAFLRAIVDALGTVGEAPEDFFTEPVETFQRTQPVVTFSSGEVAAIVGITPERLRQLEKEGKIPEAPREAGGGDDRVYTAELLAHVRDYLTRR